jgi:hypothetical protein
MQLRRARADFGGLGMTFDAASTGLEIVEVLLADPTAIEEARAISRQVAEELERIGIPSTALRALRFLRDALQRREATPALTIKVRLFILRAPFVPHEEFPDGDAA